MTELAKQPGKPETLWVDTPKGRIRLDVASIEEEARLFHNLLKAHFLESHPMSSGHQYAADYEHYIDRAKKCKFVAITARTATGLPIGFLAFRIDKSPITGLKVATEELWYVTPEHRGTTLARRMIEYFETVARRLDLAELYMGYSKKSASALFERAGLECRAVIYGKVLTDAHRQPASA